MKNSLSEKYLLYLREMSKKVALGSSTGDYSQVLIRSSKRNTSNKFQRITDLKLKQVTESGINGYKRELDQEKIGNGIFCGIGILAGTYFKKINSKSILRLIAAPIIYGQVVFEESGQAWITEWVVNYDIAAALIGRNADEEDEAYASFDPSSGKTGNQIIQDIEDTLDSTSTEDILTPTRLSEDFINGFAKLTETSYKIVEKPLACIQAAIHARDIQKIKTFFFCPGDWIFFAPVPQSLSTYRALDDLAKEIGS